MWSNGLLGPLTTADGWIRPVLSLSAFVAGWMVILIALTWLGRRLASALPRGSRIRLVALSLAGPIVVWSGWFLLAWGRPVGLAWVYLCSFVVISLGITMTSLQMQDLLRTDQE